MNRVYLVATAASKMEAKGQEIVEAVTKAGLIASIYKPLDVVNAADIVKVVNYIKEINKRQRAFEPIYTHADK